MDTNYLTVRQATRVLDVSAETIRHWLRLKPGLGTKVLGEWRLDEAIVEQLANGARPDALSDA
jgi:hypothetical protein